MRVHLLAVALVLLSSLAIAQQNKPLEFGGLKVGMSRAEFMAAEERSAQRSRPQDIAGLSQQDRDNLLLVLPKPKIPKCLDYHNGKVECSGGAALDVRFLDDKLVYAAWSFGRVTYSSMRSALIERLGEPERVQEGRYITGLGIPVNGEVLTWQSGSTANPPWIELDIRQYLGSLDDYAITITDMSRFSEYRKRSPKP